MMFFLSDEMPFSSDELLLIGAASGGKAIEATATGNPLTFLTDLARPLKSLSIPFTPIQEGSGDPSPSNIRPIVPWEGLTVYHSGADTSEYTETDISFPSPVYGGQHEAVSGKMNVPVAFAEFDGSDDESWNVGAIDENKSRAFIALAGAPKSGYNRDIIGNYIKPTASAQSSPDLWTANINASGNILIGIDPSITTVEGWKAYLAEHPLQIVYPLATPHEITLTAEQITALVGNNTIWSDANGQLTAVYLKKA